MPPASRAPTAPGGGGRAPGGGSPATPGVSSAAGGSSGAARSEAAAAGVAPPPRRPAAADRARCLIMATCPAPAGRACRSGGIGRRAGLKIRSPKGGVGSSPTFGTTVLQRFLAFLRRPPAYERPESPLLADICRRLLPKPYSRAVCADEAGGLRSQLLHGTRNDPRKSRRVECQQRSGCDRFRCPRKRVNSSAWYAMDTPLAIGDVKQVRTTKSQQLALDLGDVPRGLT